MSFTHSRRKLKRYQRTTSKQRAVGSHRLGDDLKVTESIGNVFRDLGRTEAQTRNLTMRSDLMIQIAELIRERALTQARAAKLFGVTQPRISDLMRGKISLFSLETLIAMLAAANVRVRLIVEPNAA